MLNSPHQFTSPSDYIMEKHQEIFKSEFDSKSFANTYFNGEDYELMWYVEDFYHGLFTQGKLPGKNLLDVGCGPTIRAVALASRYITEIYSSDLLQQNLNFVQKWLSNEPDAFDFSKLLKYIAKLEGHSDIKRIEDRIRKTTKGLFLCDVLADNPLHPIPHQQFDIVVSSYCLDCIPDRENYIKGAKGIASFVKSGGHLAFLGCLDTESYVIGNKVFKNANVNGKIVEEVFTKVGLKVLEVNEIPLKKLTHLTNDFKGLLTLYATKM